MIKNCSNHTIVAATQYLMQRAETVPCDNPTSYNIKTKKKF